MWVERLARIGYLAKGIVYAIVGVLAVQAAVGSGGQTTDTKGALSAIAAQPFGKFLLALLTVGLIGYMVWRFVQAVQDPEHKGDDAKGWATRLGYAVSGLIYASLAFTAIGLIRGSGGGGGGNSEQDWTARLLAQPFGQWLVGLVGAFVIGLGFYQLYQAYKAKFRKQMKLQEMSPTEETWATRIGRFGLGARGVVFCIIGFFLLQAARQSDASEVRGLDGALQSLAQQPYGPWLLGIVALGLVAYGIHMAVQARYIRIPS
ncbi:DUF1206 domain-containing protein [Microcoleus sp. FACHB-SPT15]|uniref:DUF1206 domain-containing protein n=1 Tax=Microcoleus sp. FACHB-SPT15 TaxID=2692830 RepID=UPI00177BE3F4|nr:DUF1206 domain-containing protein [Microcoleus sp. FACHB-SPT15]MBD1804142.1 DUF1206 domain-containing protein [Microcoleus sp. FACHB-SPT15]